MTDCLFCKIIAGDVPSTKIAENDAFLAFLDIAPITKGHTLVIPKTHCTDVEDFPTELGKEWFSFVQEVANKVTKGVSADGFVLGMNNGEAAGQVVFHQHTHIIPRYEDDELSSWPGHEKTSEELDAVAKQILE